MQKSKAPLLEKSGFLRLPQILELFPISRSAWWAHVKSGRFPAPYKLSSNTSVWKAQDIYDLIEAIENGTLNTGEKK